MKKIPPAIPEIQAIKLLKNLFVLFFFSHTSQKSLQLNLAKICNMYGGLNSKGEYQYQIWHKSDQHSRSYKWLYT